MEMPWLPLALLTALASASQDAWVKRSFSHLDIYEMGLYPLIYGLPLFLAALAFIPVPELDSDFWMSLLASLPLNAAAYLLYMKAIKISPLSLTLPFLAFTPVFVILTGALVLGEQPSAGGAAGVVLTLLGSYILYLDPKNLRPLAPLRAIAREKGSRLMICTALIYSVTSVLDKRAVLHSSALFYGVFFYIAFAPLMLLLMAAFGRRAGLSLFGRERLKGAFAGLLLFCHGILHPWAISLTKAAYMISVKRLSIFFGILYGRMLFKESDILVRLCGSALMIAGVALIALSG